MLALLAQKLVAAWPSVEVAHVRSLARALQRAKLMPSIAPLRRKTERALLEHQGK
jgi:hypothetical protein